ncbi:hypothetical protein BV25DRAFT_1921277 [Artomyces pyxidatus]|uniref:Uncharacterized protein n=1 Tax=Artomyces pyxidatus TaxID=48021 RepID=A0ACB8SII0_9AGAM|nr:hypothetical protein BV25DRAFT_1921277 [Artomyces pyxidatus]
MTERSRGMPITVNYSHEDFYLTFLRDQLSHTRELRVSGLLSPSELGALTEAVPILERLKLHGLNRPHFLPPAVEDLPPNLLNSDAPRLREISLTALRFSWSMLPTNCLTRLALRSCIPMTVGQMEPELRQAFLEVLLASPSLEVLSLDHTLSQFQSPENTMATHHIPLPHLSELTLVEFPAYIIWLLNQIDFPSTSKIRLLARPVHSFASVAQAMFAVVAAQFQSAPQSLDPFQTLAIGCDSSGLQSTADRRPRSTTSGDSSTFIDTKPDLFVELVHSESWFSGFDVPVTFQGICDELLIFTDVQGLSLDFRHTLVTELRLHGHRAIGILETLGGHNPELGGDPDISAPNDMMFPALHSLFLCDVIQEDCYGTESLWYNALAPFFQSRRSQNAGLKLLAIERSVLPESVLLLLHNIVDVTWDRSCKDEDYIFKETSDVWDEYSDEDEIPSSDEEDPNSDEEVPPLDEHHVRELLKFSLMNQHLLFTAVP